MQIKPSKRLCKAIEKKYHITYQVFRCGSYAIKNNNRTENQLYFGIGFKITLSTEYPLTLIKTNWIGLDWNSNVHLFFLVTLVSIGLVLAVVVVAVV